MLNSQRKILTKGGRDELLERDLLVRRPSSPRPLGGRRTHKSHPLQDCPYQRLGTSQKGDGALAFFRIG